MSPEFSSATMKLLQDDARQGRLTLFIGGDLPRGVTGLPSGRDLAAGLADRYQLPATPGGYTLPEAAELAGRRGDVIRFLAGELDTTRLRPLRFDQVAAGLASLPLLITTRYDNLIEKALGEINRPYDPLVSDIQVSLRVPGRLALLKLYGDLQQPQSITLVQNDLFDLSFTKRGLMGVVEQALSGTTLVFLGYDLNSPEFRSLWGQVLRRLSQFAPRAFAAVGRPLDSSEQSAWRNNNIELLAAAPWDFLEALAAGLPRFGPEPAAAPPPSGSELPVREQRPETAATGTGQAAAPAYEPAGPPVRAYRNFDLDLRQSAGQISVSLRSAQGEADAEAASFGELPPALDSLASLGELDESIGLRLMPGSVFTRWAANWASARDVGDGLRVRLRIHGDDLAGVAWEAANVDGELLALQPETPMVRYVAAGRPPDKLKADLPLRLLVLLSASAEVGLPELNTQQERSLIEDALAELTAGPNPRLEIAWLEGAITWEELQDVLRRFKPHLLHYIGHGAYDERSKIGSLFLGIRSGDQIQPVSVDTDRLVLALRRSPVRFALINACQSGRAAGGVAQSLVQALLPAALGMQANIPNAAAAAFAGAFYRALADGWPVDAAVVEGRALIALQENLDSPNWALPVLYMRAEDGMLWDLAASKSAQGRSAGSEPVRGGSTFQNAGDVFMVDASGSSDIAVGKGITQTNNWDSNDRWENRPR